MYTKSIIILKQQSIKRSQSNIVTDWDHTERLIEHGLSDRLRISCSEHPILLAEPAFDTRFNRERMATLVFEKFGVPAMFLAKNPVLAAFASGKATALVVESGAAVSVVTPVYDGYALTKGIVRTNYAGDAVSAAIAAHYDSQKIEIKAPYMFTKSKISDDRFEVRDLDFPNTTRSYREFSVMVS